MNTQPFQAQIDAFVRETGASLRASSADLAQQTAASAAHLAAIANEPGIEEAIAREVSTLRLAAGIAAIEDARAADHRLVGMFVGFLAAAAGGA
jgi:hypothetical protein